jgi:hypothetical protein
LYLFPREKETDELLSKMPKQIESYFQRITKKQKADEEKLNKKREILDQAREFYGYEVDMRDSRYINSYKKTVFLKNLIENFNFIKLKII